MREDREPHIAGESDEAGIAEVTLSATPIAHRKKRGRRENKDDGSRGSAAYWQAMREDHERHGTDENRQRYPPMLCALPPLAHSEIFGNG